MTDELRACPWCAAPPLYIEQVRGRYHVVITHGDHCPALDDLTRTKTRTIELWNTRPLEDALRAKLAEAYEVMEVWNVEQVRLNARVAELEAQWAAVPWGDLEDAIAGMPNVEALEWIAVNRPQEQEPQA